MEELHADLQQKLHTNMLKTSPLHHGIEKGLLMKLPVDAMTADTMPHTVLLAVWSHRGKRDEGRLPLKLLITMMFHPRQFRLSHPQIRNSILKGGRSMSI